MDVTSKCSELNDWAGERCSAAELWILPDQTGYSDNNTDVVAHVLLAYNQGETVLTNGQVVSSGINVREARLRVRTTDACWYLDSTFCYTFNQWHYAGANVLLIIQTIAAALFGICALVVLCSFQGLFNALCCHGPVRPRSGSEQRELIEATRGRKGGFFGICSRCQRLIISSAACSRALEFLAKLRLAPLLIALFGITIAPTFYVRIFLPCWDCYDFEAVMAHEAGHVLGFQHPDTMAGANLIVTSPMNSTTCESPTSHLALQPEVTDSIMFSMTKHRAATCLEKNDLDGLNTLYPVCSGYLNEPTCVKTRRDSGWLRLIVAVAVPYMLVTVLLLLVQGCVRAHQQHIMKVLAARVERVRNDGERLVAFLQRVSSREGRGNNVGGNQPQNYMQATLEASAEAERMHRVHQEQQHAQEERMLAQAVDESNYERALEESLVASEASSLRGSPQHRQSRQCADSGVEMAGARNNAGCNGSTDANALGWASAANNQNNLPRGLHAEQPSSEAQLRWAMEASAREANTAREADTGLSNTGAATPASPVAAEVSLRRDDSELEALAELEQYEANLPSSERLSQIGSSAVAISVRTPPLGQPPPSPPAYSNIASLGRHESPTQCSRSGGSGRPTETGSQGVPPSYSAISGGQEACINPPTRNDRGFDTFSNFI